VGRALTYQSIVRRKPAFGAPIATVILIIGLTSWPQTARVARAEFLTLREREFVLAARSAGGSDPRIMTAHVLPNALPPIVVTATLRAGTGILTEAALGFLGASDPNVISWGQLLLGAVQVMREAWWTVLFPGAAISLTILALNILGDALADARPTGWRPPAAAGSAATSRAGSAAAAPQAAGRGRAETHARHDVARQFRAVRPEAAGGSAQAIFVEAPPPS
jgi:Binding-protein-dependent transport system inner membrane component